MRMRMLLLLLSALAVLLATFLAWEFVSARQLEVLKDRAAHGLSLKSNSVLAEIERYRNLPFVLGQDERIQRLLDTPDDSRLVEAANKYLETANRSPKSDQFFLLNAEGTTLASSNWRAPTSFVGQSYKFRRYFRDAMSKGEGHHYAVGVTSGIPGYFLARSINTAAGSVGVLVVKVDISTLEQTWTAAGEHIGLIDDVGMIFLSSISNWKYRPLSPLSNDVRERIHSEKLYPDEYMATTPLLQTRPDTQADLYMQVQGSETLLRFVEIPEQGWWILAAYDIAPVHLTANVAAAIVFLATALIFVLGFYLLERRQRGRANRLRVILENMSAGIAVFDPELRLVAWNDKYIRMNSYPESLVRAGRDYADIIRYNIARGDHGPGDPKKQLQERLDRTRQHAVRQFEVRRPDGTWVDIVRSRMPDGTLIQTYTDITERKRAEAELDTHRNNLESLVKERTDELEVAKKAAEEANRAKTTFLNSISHDIRNPLNAILGYASLVLSNAKESLPEKQYQNLEKLSAKGRELNEMVSDFLDYTRADRVNTSRFALPPLIQECLTTIEPMIGSQRIQIVCRIPDGLPMLVQDERKLRSVIMNLLTNAAKFTDAGEIRLTVQHRDGSIDISVGDTGIGIAEESLDRIFNEFERIESPGERPREGTGLGLAICRRFAFLMGGTITVQSKRGKGSEFTLLVPIKHPKAIAIAESAGSGEHRDADVVAMLGRAKAATADGRATVLIVDDSKENRDFLTQLLERHCHVLVAEDGKKAIQIAQLERPDLILMDLSLPVIDGWEATRTIKGDAGLRSIPIVVVTAHVTTQDRDEARAAGCDDFLSKPVDEKALFVILRRHLGLQIGELTDG